MATSKIKLYYKKDTKNLIKFLSSKNTKLSFIMDEYSKPDKKSDLIIADEIIGDVKDVQKFFSRIKNNSHHNSRFLVTYYNFLWRPILKMATFIGWREEIEEQNWLDNNDISNLLKLSGFEIISTHRRLLIPIYIPFISNFVNKWIASLPLINIFCLKTWILAKHEHHFDKNFSVSIIIPCRNEEGNIPIILKKIPRFGKFQEIIFVEGYSTDDTWDVINIVLRKYYKNNVVIRAFKQKGEGKADAVRLGFDKAKGDILMILDADMTVEPRDLPKFYQALASGDTEFANGSRLVYPMEKEAMNTLNLIGNKIFSWLFTWVLGQRFKDTLCGTKALFKRDYEKIKDNRKFFGDFDPFGDFDLIFGAVKQNLKIIEIPVRYKERVYGTTNIRRFRHGWLLLKMFIFAFKKFNF